MFDFYCFLAATKYCQLTHAQSDATRIMGHAQFLYESIAERSYPIPKNIGGGEVARQSKKLLTDICRSVTMCRKVQMFERKQQEQLRRAANIEGDVQHESDQDLDWSTDEVCRHPFLLALLLLLIFNLEKLIY